ncbi:hypothetical protein BDY17DRAFT_313340 [Neohortaea acidophila]|uniref:RING-type E3 ubiquitin transferase n=1 Tax=Neohortaea acidophila TaxID=245834 RepID=A0A6A6PHN4_9PEZI|nr:uncharacterized protein BDY17DRAFT_313340 [Neohortaea acidophila]KAF2479538.1 hypothetical protein BDY17DRAFT_313340 [Neohortaea acidophila]
MSNGRPRDIVYCHECDNEWYRDEHGLTCPSCTSDFTEIVESANDPRGSEQHEPEDSAPAGGYGDYYAPAPDPDEEDIDNLRWTQTGPDTYRLRGTYRTDIPITPGTNLQQPGAAQPGLMGMVGSVLQNMLGGGQQQQQQPQPQQPQSPQQPRSQSPWEEGGQRPGIPPHLAALQRSPTPGSPPGNGTFVRHGSGPGFTYTIATTGTSNFGGGGGGGGGHLLPRNANGPQPFQPQPDHIEQMLAQLFANIGAGPVGPDGRMQGAGQMGGPIMFGGPGGQVRGMPFGDIFQLFGPPGGVAGDAVYSQEALDRVITQLMEQHQAGHAPGPATEAAIKSLPIKTISKSDLGETGKADCSICMDEVPVGDSVTELPCHHWFHADCIRAWLSEHDTCPHCRQGIMPKDGDANSSRPRQPNQAPRHDMRSPEYTRPSDVPGAYPFPRQNSGQAGGDGTQQNPYTVPNSPNMYQPGSPNDDRRRSSGNGMFSRMRDAFGGGGSNGGRG